MYSFTICFIKQGNNILLLNRESPEWMGIWNGVGGKLEEGETHLNVLFEKFGKKRVLRLSRKTFGIRETSPGRTHHTLILTECMYLWQNYQRHSSTRHHSKPMKVS